MVARVLSGLGLLITALDLLAVQCQEEDIIVTVQQGRLKGLLIESVRGQGLLAFLGIPYARPPVGELRFKVWLLRFFLVLFSDIVSTAICAYRRVKYRRSNQSEACYRLSCWLIFRP
jgi:carboxylesterase type B